MITTLRTRERSSEKIFLTLISVMSRCFINPPLGCAFAAPFAKGGLQTRERLPGGFGYGQMPLRGFSDEPTVSFFTLLLARVVRN